MPEWWTYSLSDLVMYTRQTYYRLFELYNVAIWPVQVLTIGAGVAIWALLRRPDARRGRFVASVLAACWVWVSIAFLAKRYATINWAAVDFAWAFGVEAALLLWTGVVRGRLVFDREAGPVPRAGAAIFLFAVGIQPLTGLLFGRAPRQLEFFGVAPDPTAVATLGVALTAVGRTRWEHVVIPAIWCAFSAAMLWAMKMPDAWVMTIAGVSFVALAVAKAVALRRRPSRREAIPQV